MSRSNSSLGTLQFVQGVDPSGDEAPEDPGRFTSYPAGAVFIGEATVTAVLPPRVPSEGPILILETPEFRAVRYRNDIPSGAAGVMEFTTGPVILKQPVWIEISAAAARFVDSQILDSQHQDMRLGYVIAQPIVFERFLVIGGRFRFIVRAGQPGWKPAPGEVDAATATYLNLFLS